MQMGNNFFLAGRKQMLTAKRTAGTPQTAVVLQQLQLLSPHWRYPHADDTASSAQTLWQHFGTNEAGT